MENYVLATYRIQSESYDFAKKAQGIAMGLTVGSWTDLPLAKQEMMQQHLGQVADIRELPAVYDNLYAAEIQIAYPVINFSPDIPAILTTVFGKLSMDGKVRLIDLQIPDTFARQFPGPKFGIQGVREILGVQDRPLLMSIFKSGVGMELKELADQFYQQALGGVDLIKDDEIFFSETYAPFAERVRACRDKGLEAAETTGQRVLYAANLSGPVTKMIDKAKYAIEAGANALLLNVLPYGYDILQRLAEDPDIPVPLVAHPALSGALYGSADYGIAAHIILGTLMRMAGADLVLYPSPYGSVAMERGETLKIAGQLRSEHAYFKQAFAVPSAGIHPGLVPMLFEDLGMDLIVNAGGGVHGHPMGPAAGGQAFRQAIAAVLAGQSLERAAESQEELRIALQVWGKK
ncbi:2,3-diketo-5-methylthiopentyl-1-phosphate enolase [Fodinisporobacter ferrooxydans]|uniref:2,3-diketo-5-methylthiopentyl-1-phosphate enolase n=1 Tax=Fodinisporobacter ferrooxydans TaxID=2901836 RepID=A0ABY4CJ32_9BACL|nr:2,3-diketo-5-methylthiopentyl-1-phosphate enolase [Alicyclobacillaceae bacterium MYW30-H2]